MLQRFLQRPRLYSSSASSCACSFPEPGTDIDTSSPLPRVSPYNHHLLVSSPNSPSEWPSYLGDDADEISVRQWASDLKPLKVLVNRYHDPHHTSRVLAFPSGTSWPSNVTRASLQSLVTHGSGGSQLKGPQVLICGHRQRDARCGQAASIMVPHIEAWFERMQRPGNVRVVSHLGGHKFAGVMVIYVPPIKEGEPWSSVWYSRVKSDNLDEILQKTIVEGRVVPHLARHTTGIFLDSKD